MKIKNLITNILPFNNKTEMSTPLYIIKKMLAFFFIYGLSALLGEAVVIGSLTILGFDPLHGVMPSDNVAQLIQYYGFAVFFIVAMLYCRLFEKRNAKSVGFNNKVFDYITGSGLAIVLLAVIVGVCCVIGTFSFDGFNSGVNVIQLVLLFGAFIIQSLAEEVICRGFLLKSLTNKASLPIAIFVSSTAFALPHLSSVLSAEGGFAVVGVINLYLVSTVFSLLFMLRTNIYIVAGLHCVWNFVLNGVMGLSVSGSNTNSNALMNFEVNANNLLSGGVYGIEASILTTVVFGVVAIILVNLYRKRGRA